MVGSAGEGGIHLLVGGVDAGRRTVLAPLLDAGDLPAVERLLADETWGSLDPGIPPLTASASAVGTGRFGEPMESWDHGRAGVVVAAGGSSDGTAAIDGASVFDVAPTVCALFGVPIDDDADGTTLSVVDGASEASSPSYERDRTDLVDGASVKSRPSQLGYRPE